MATIELADFGIIGALFILEGLLSTDNALVLAILVKHLPKSQQKKALTYGLMGALVFRLLGILAAKWILQLWYLRLLGGGYLLYLCLKYFWSERKKKAYPHAPEEKEIGHAGFWKTIALVELTDVAFAVDSILVAVAMSEKLWVIWVGGILGIIAMRLVANVFVDLIEKFPILTHYAYLIVGWVALKLVAHSYTGFQITFSGHSPEEALHLMPGWLFWVGMIGICGFALLNVYKLSKKAN